MHELRFLLPFPGQSHFERPLGERVALRSTGLSLEALDFVLPGGYLSVGVLALIKGHVYLLDVLGFLLAEY